MWLENSHSQSENDDVRPSRIEEPSADCAVYCGARLAGGKTENVRGKRKTEMTKCLGSTLVGCLFASLFIYLW
jgi:hypothetical protein